jgi:hypothetical protein
MDGLMSLLAQTEYQGLVIKEWNIVQFSKLTRVLQAIAKEYKEKNVAWEGFSEILVKADGAGIAGISNSMLEFLSPFVEHAPLILGISCNVDEKKLNTLSYTDGIIVLLLVLKANLEHLNNFFVKIVAPVEEQPATMASI